LRPAANWNLHRIPAFVAVTAALRQRREQCADGDVAAHAGARPIRTGWLTNVASTLAGISPSPARWRTSSSSTSTAEGVHVGYLVFRVGLPVTVSTLAAGSIGCG
jgi:hypothetical protein